MNGRTIIRKGAVSAMLLALGIMIACVLAIGVAPAQDAYAASNTKTASVAVGKTFKVDGNTYKVTDRYKSAYDPGEVVLVKYASNNKKPVINTVTYKGKKYEVEAVGANAFNNAKGRLVTKVTLGRNVDSVRSRAFYGCSKLQVLNIAKSDIIDVEYSRRTGSFYLDDIEIGSQAFTKAGTKNVKVQCANSNAKYKQVVKKALVSKGMRSSVTITH